MIHLHVVRQLMHHDHLDLAKAHPAAVLATQHQLDDFAVVEISADEFVVGFVLLQRGDGEMVLLHEGEALGGNGAEEGVGVVVFGLEWGWTWKRLDEGDAVVGVGGRRVV